MRDFLIKKEPLQQFETLFVKLPIIEIKYFMSYNEGKTGNHFFNQQNVRTHEDWLDRVKTFITKSSDVELHLNIPSLGAFNETQKNRLYLPLLLQQYAESSPIPILHYQRSHMQFFDEFMRELQQKRIDISKKVYTKTQYNQLGKNERYTTNFMPLQLERQRTKFKGYMDDIILLMTDFKEEIGYGVGGRGGQGNLNDTDIFEGMDINEQLISNDEIDDHARKDQFLNRYNGIVLTNENLCVQSDFTYRPNHHIFFEINDSLASFNLFRFSKMSSKNLFKIRHPCFNIYRSMQFEKSLNNFSQFCKFFNIDENKPLENNENSVRQKFPEYS